MAVQGLSFPSTGRSVCQLGQAVFDQSLSHHTLALGDVLCDRKHEELFDGTRIAHLELTGTQFDRICPSVVTLEIARLVSAALQGEPSASC
jgi:hypothetical protein